MSHTLTRLFKLASETCLIFFDFLSFLDAFALQAFYEFSWKCRLYWNPENLNFLKYKIKSLPNEFSRWTKAWAPIYSIRFEKPFQLIAQAVRLFPSRPTPIFLKVHFKCVFTQNRNFYWKLMPFFTQKSLKFRWTFAEIRKFGKSSVGVIQYNLY